jgi:hypothetical protein
MLVLIIGAQYLAVILGAYLGLAPVFARRPWLIPHGWNGVFAPVRWVDGLGSLGWFPAVDFGAFNFILGYQPPASIAALALAIEGIRILATSQSRKDDGPRICLYLALFGYVAWLMWSEPFCYYRGDLTFIAGALLLTPLLLAIGPLVRRRAWVGVCAVFVFVAVALAMLIANGCNELGMTGFFTAEVS